MTFELADTTWTSPSGVWHDAAPFAGLENPLLAGGLVAGRAVLAALSKPQVLTALGVGLGVGQLASAFKDGDTFAEGWEDGKAFDQRMAMIHQIWLKLNDRLAKCAPFMKSPNLVEYRHDRDRFSAFYAKTGKVTSRASSYVGLTPSPTGTEIGAATSFWAELMGWVALGEKLCPGKIAPGLSEVLEEASRDKTPGGLGWGTVGVLAGAFVLGMYFLSRRAPVQVYTGVPQGG